MHPAVRSSPIPEEASCAAPRPPPRYPCMSPRVQVFSTDGPGGCKKTSPRLLYSLAAAAVFRSMLQVCSSTAAYVVDVEVHTRTSVKKKGNVYLPFLRFTCIPKPCVEMKYSGSSTVRWKNEIIEGIPFVKKAMARNINDEKCFALLFENQIHRLLRYVCRYDMYNSFA